MGSKAMATDVGGLLYMPMSFTAAELFVLTLSFSRLQRSRSAGKYELGQKENECVPASEIIIMNEACMAEKPAGVETSVHSVTPKCGDGVDSEGDQKNEEEDDQRVLHLEDEETHL